MAGLISEQDYLGTGFGRDGLPTREYSRLGQSAAMEKEQAGRKTALQEKMTGVSDPEKIHVSGNASLLKVYDLQVSGRNDGFLWIDEEPIKRGDGFSLYPMGDGLSALLVPAVDELNHSASANSFGMLQEGLQKSGAPSMPHRAVIFKDAVYRTILAEMSRRHINSYRRCSDGIRLTSSLQGRQGGSMVHPAGILTSWAGNS